MHFTATIDRALDTFEFRNEDICVQYIQVSFRLTLNNFVAFKGLNCIQNIYNDVYKNRVI